MSQTPATSANPVDAPKRDPFGPAASAATYVAREATDVAFERLERAVVEEGRIAVLHGPGGLGKTLLLHRLAERAKKIFTPVHLPYAAMTPDEVCSWTLEALGANAADDPTTVFGSWLEHLRRERSLLLLVVDDATALPVETARWLVQLAKDGVLRLALAALEEGERPAFLDEMSEDAERIHLHEPMSEDETRAYVEGRLAMAEAPEEQRALFNLASIRRLHRIAQGNPRRLHHAASAVLRGADPNTIVAFLDGLEPDADADAEGRVTIGAALLAERRAEEARKPAPRKIKPMAPPPLSEADEPPALLRPETFARPAAQPEAAPPEPSETPEPLVGSGPPAIPEAAQVLADALGGESALLRDLEFDPAELDVPELEQDDSLEEEAELELGSEPASEESLPEPAAPEEEAQPLEPPPWVSPSSAAKPERKEGAEDLDAVLHAAGSALLEATALLRSATLRLGSPGTPRGRARAALRDAVDALTDAIVAVHKADGRTSADPNRSFRIVPERGVLGALGRVAAVVVGSALLGAASVFFLVGSEAPQIVEEAPAAEAVDVVEPEPASAAAEAAPLPTLYEIGINARPWAKVEVDGLDIGMTPIAGLELEEGLHIFRAQMPDGRIVVRRIEIGPETNRSLVFR